MNERYVGRDKLVHVRVGWLMVEFPRVPLYCHLGDRVTLTMDATGPKDATNRAATCMMCVAVCPW